MILNIEVWGASLLLDLKMKIKDTSEQTRVVSGTKDRKNECFGQSVRFI